MAKDKDIVNLENFMIHIDELDKLSQYRNEINFFEITDITRKEIKHSNFLAWLLDSNANHNIGDKFIRRFMQKVVKANQSIEIIAPNIINLFLLDYDSFIIKREWMNIDIFMVSDEAKFTITIENKIYSSERINQTFDYRKKIEEIYKSYTNIYIYLTIEGEEAQDGEYWCCANYEMVKDTIEELLQENVNLSEDVKLLLKNYVAMVRRDILVDKNIEKICKDIYRKYKDGLELIYKYGRPNEISSISDYIINYLNENATKYNIVYDEKYSSRTIIRFTTNFMDSIIPKNEDYSYGWKNGYGFMYEIVLKNDAIICSATICNASDNNCIKLYKLAQQNCKKLNLSRKKAELPNLWSRVFRSNKLLTKEQTDDEFNESIKAELKANLDKLFEIEIPSFEKFVKDNF